MVQSSWIFIHNENEFLLLLLLLLNQSCWFQVNDDDDAVAAAAAADDDDDGCSGGGGVCGVTNNTNAIKSWQKDHPSDRWICIMLYVSERILLPHCWRKLDH